LESDVLVAETILGSDWCPAFSMEIVKIRSGGVGWDIKCIIIKVKEKSKYYNEYYYNRAKVK
jgi:hypothetical protein